MHDGKANHPFLSVTYQDQNNTAKALIYPQRVLPYPTIHDRLPASLAVLLEDGGTSNPTQTRHTGPLLQQHPPDMAPPPCLIVVDWFIALGKNLDLNGRGFRTRFPLVQRSALGIH